MTPQDVPGEIVTIEALFPWLPAILPVQDAVRPLRREPDSEPEREQPQLSDAA